jgi:hypothetical protein
MTASWRIAAQRPDYSIFCFFAWPQEDLHESEKWCADVYQQKQVWLYAKVLTSGSFDRNTEHLGWAYCFENPNGLLTSQLPGKNRA